MLNRLSRFDNFYKDLFPKIFIAIFVLKFYLGNIKVYRIFTFLLCSKLSLKSAELQKELNFEPKFSASLHPLRQIYLEEEIWSFNVLGG